MYTIIQGKKVLSTYPSEKEVEYDEGFHHKIASRLKAKNASKDEGVDQLLLQNFYILIPALSLTFLENSMRGKDMLNKNFQTCNAYYTDDGFAMGTAFILEVLN